MRFAQPNCYWFKVICGSGNKIGSTIRIGVNAVLPFIKIDKNSISKVIKTWINDQIKLKSIFEFQPFCWLIDRSLKLGPDNETFHWFSSQEIDTDAFKSRTNNSLFSLKIDVIASK